jgi:hypothetical protein
MEVFFKKIIMRHKIKRMGRNGFYLDICHTAVENDVSRRRYMRVLPDNP